MNKIENIVKKYIIHHGMFKWQTPYIVALSGGADSVALLLILKNIGLNISAAHCNFHLRGEESDRDEQFCVNLCQQQGISLSRIHFDTYAYAHLHKVSIEMAARDLRYRYFAQLVKDLHAGGICVAHHRDDNVETLLLNLLRGSGVDGLAGIAPKNGNILRPLLCISRQDILQYLKEKKQDFVTDSTNLEDDALRNKIRHHVVPLLESINPAASENIALSAKYIRQAKSILESMDSISTTDSNRKVIYIPKISVMNAPSPEFILHKELGRYGFHGNVIDDICENLFSQDRGVGKIWKNEDYMIVIDREQLLISNIKDLNNIQEQRAFRLPEEGIYNMDEGTQIKIRIFSHMGDFMPSKESQCITLDAEKVSFPLTYRLVKEGDRFQPFGMKGSKLLSDYMTDRKFDYIQKKTQHVLTDSKGEIIWLIGERTSEKTKITETTKKILEVIIK